MQLKLRVVGSRGDSENESFVIRAMEDLDVVARKVASRVKAWSRQVPLKRGGSRFTIDVFAEWVERGIPEPK